MPPPRLVVEVVSPGKKNIDRDYRYKRSQYEARGVAEYWIVDPIAQRVTVLNRIEGLYEAVLFENDAAIAHPGRSLTIASTLLGELAIESELTAAQILRARC